MKKICILFIIFISALFFSQKKLDKDSLLAILKTSKNDTNKVKLYYLLSSEYVTNDIDSAKLFLKNGKELANKLAAHQFTYDYYFTEVKIFHADQDYEQALVFNLKAISEAEKNKNQYQKAEALRALFVIYMNLNQNEKAIKTAHQALQLTKKIKDTANFGSTYGNLSKLYLQLGQYDKAVDFGKKGIEASKKYKNLKGLLISLNNVALSLKNLGKISQAEEKYKELLQIAYKNNIPRSVVKSLVNLGFIAAGEADSQKLNLYLQELDAYIKNNPDAPFLKSDKNLIPFLKSYNLLYQQKFNLAEEIAINNVGNKDNDLDFQYSYYILLSQIGYVKKDFKKAQQYVAKSDSIQNIITREDLNQFEINANKKYETQKKEAQIKLQESKIKQKNIFNYSLLISTVALLLILILTYRNFSHRKKLQQQRISELETEKQLLATESLLKGQEEERGRLAKDLHDGLGGLLSGVKLHLGAMKGNLILTQDNGIIFDKALDKLDESISEMRRVAHNMMPEALLKLGLQQAVSDYCASLSQHHQLEINCEMHGLNERLDGTVEVVLYRIIQELVNNAIKHANAKHLLVQIVRQENGQTSVTVEDDGIGFDIDKINVFQSAGIQNIRSRVNYLRGNMDVKTKPGKGTSVYIECNTKTDG